MQPGGNSIRVTHDLVLQPGVDDALAAVDQVVDVVQRVEVADRRHAVLLEQLGVQLDDVAGLRIESDDVDAAGQRLQVRVRSGRLAKRVHHVERVFVAVEVQRLEARAAAGLEVADARVAGRFERGQKVLGEDAGSEDGLKAVPERRTHEVLTFFFDHRFSHRSVSRSISSSTPTTNAGGDRRTDHAGHVGCHGVHQQEIVRVFLLADHLDDAAESGTAETPPRRPAD